jgi:hypothetical protein
MRKFAVVGLAVLGLCAVAGIAYASNTYHSTSKVTPSSTGTAASPKPVAVELAFTVGETSGNRPSSLAAARIGLGAGIQPNTAVAKGCSSAQANAAILPAACDKLANRGGSQVGNGSVNALIGGSNDPTAKIPCFLYVRLLASTKKNHMWIRLDGKNGAGLQAPFPPSVRGKTCPANQNVPIDSTFVKVGSVARKGGGAKVPVYELRFTVPANLVHPLPGFDSSVVSNVTNILKVSKRIGRVTHGFLESIGCPKAPAGKRSSTVTFTSAAGQRTFSTSTSRCS